ncbi:MAG TPA: DEAD/DEAH box helicase [Thermoanaerobaculia bacterium]|jgi:ATP-dependent RNA helicase DeaD|nr:DEAD/DEAH box helicase [Thermoanaerobaculia bacterium]
MSTFAELGLRPEIVEVLTSLGYEAPTPIQERTIPLLLAGRDLIGQAQTGTGKTAAFALPILQKIDPKKKHTQALVLTPTRELAMQVAEAVHSYAAKMEHVSVIPVYGGAPIVPQLKRLERGAHVVVGTPGRLIDHLDRGSLNLSHIRVVVLDEADEMLKMGFIEDMEKILGALPAERQTALFSATMADEVLRIAKRHQRNPERVEIEHHKVNTPSIEQRFLNVSEGQKLEVLTQILELEPAEAVLIFRRTKTGSADLAEKLEARGFAAVAMHGDMSQPLREAVIRRLRAGQVEIVVATDVAARGLDVEQIEHVINYDIPYDVEAYVHRIGRTGRAGRSGVATMFITPRERKMMREIERFTGNPIKPMKLPTRADVAAKRISVFKETVRKSIQDGDLEAYVELVEQLAEEGPFDMADVAAAAARIANGSKALVQAREQEISLPVVESSSRRVEEPPRRLEDSATRRPDKTIRMSIAIGRREGIRPADIVGSIANEADVPGREIGPIDIQDEVTYVGIPERFVDAVIEKVGRKKFRGKALNIRVAPTRDEGPPKRRAPAPRFDDRRPAPRRTDDRRPAPPRADDRRPRAPQKPFDRFAKKKPRR